MVQRLAAATWHLDARSFTRYRVFSQRVSNKVKKVDKTMDKTKEILFLDALTGIESELKKLNALLVR